MSKLASTSEYNIMSIDPIWHEFLTSQGGEIVDGQETVFRQNYPKIPDHYVVPCTQEAVICFEGKDVKLFLQNQLTCDINELSGNRFLFGAYCNPKGRVLATFRLFQTEDSIYMVCNYSIVKSLLDRLRMFVLRSDVIFRVRSDLVVICANTFVNHSRSRPPAWYNVGPAWPDECNGTLGSSQPVQLIVIPVANAIQLIKEKRSSTVLLDSDYWNLLQIRHGVANVTTSTSGLFTPQNLNLDLISGVSFTKGCYPGQEIVARLRYLGRVKQRLLRGRLQDEGEIRVGQSVSLSGTTDNKSGVIINASTVVGSNGECLLSVYGFLESENVYCYMGQPNKPITTLPLPYQLQ